MPYGDLVKQAVQRFADYGDLDKHECTIEEREEYEPHLDNGVIVYAGVDYERILRQAEAGSRYHPVGLPALGGATISPLCLCRWAPADPPCAWRRRRPRRGESARSVHRVELGKGGAAA